MHGLRGPIDQCLGCICLLTDDLDGFSGTFSFIEQLVSLSSGPTDDDKISNLVDIVLHAGWRVMLCPSLFALFFSTILNVAMYSLECDLEFFDHLDRGRCVAHAVDLFKTSGRSSTSHDRQRRPVRPI